ncbi:MAG: hypothetical protein R3F59_12525 [Myxococcota bacterium]
MPTLAPGSPFGPASEDPQVLDAGNGVVLTLAVADLAPPILVSLVDVATGVVPLEHLPAYPALAGEELLAAYTVHPFHTTSASPVGVAVPTTLPAGAVVHFRSIDALGGTCHAPAVEA